LPVWVTAAGSPETFRAAGEIGANVLSHLLGQSLEAFEKNVRAYREAWKTAGHAGEGHVTLMLHTFVGDDDNAVRERVREPLTRYLKSSLDLLRGLARGLGQDLDSATFTAEDMDALLRHAFERYYETSALLGTRDKCVAMIERMREAGADEIGCLIDFGVDPADVMAGLDRLVDVRDAVVEDCSLRATIPEQIAAHGVTHLQCTPSLARMLLSSPEAAESLGALEALLVGGEPLPVGVASELRSRCPGALFNMYGPTETTVWSTAERVSDEDLAAGLVTVGRPIANTVTHVLDAFGARAPVGVPGELCIGGQGVALCYFGRPELTAERFVTLDTGERAYRTGDVARRLPDGRLVLLGRTDGQVKIRGVRIELGEVEALVAAHDAVAAAAAVVREPHPGDERLVAYVVPKSGRAIDVGELRSFVRERAPEHLVPSAVVTLTALPLTPNGKVDRASLPALDAMAALPKGEHKAPTTPLEAALAEIWRDVLGVPKVGVLDNFFELGGHSLLVAQVQSRILSRLARSVRIVDLFGHPTVASLAAYLSEGSVALSDDHAAAERGARRRALPDNAASRRGARRPRPV
jgi:AMP-binding enzyme/AMP-binding enzyme C-terminal domain/Luciferase-like monooxygenase/Phosphopantetheine attachment site